MRLRPISRFASTVLFAGLVAVARGQDAVTPAGDAGARAERLKEMDQVARSIKMSEVNNQGKEIPAIAAQEPLHRWTDPTREFSDGGLYAWKTTSGRPIAVVGIELYANWSLEFVSISTGRVIADANRVHWSPQRGGAEFREIAEAPAPAAGKPERFRQARELALRFSAREHWDNQHYALRLLPRPIDRYNDPDSGVVDGALFVYANGTNPEILLLIEARRVGDGPPKWMFAAMPLSHAEVTLKLGAKDVWSSPSKDSGPAVTPNDPYFDVLTPRLTVPRNRDRRPKP